MSTLQKKRLVKSAIQGQGVFTGLSKYGITESKKAELDALQSEVLDAQHVVDQESAIVTSLTAKATKLAGFLASAEANRAQALSNRNLLDEVANDALSLRNNSAIAFGELVEADSQTRVLAKEMRSLINRLIYSAEIINKLSNLVIRKKASNPLISDELVTMVGTAGTDANNAVALTLVALKSTFAAQASNIESESISALQLTQVEMFLDTLTGDLCEEGLPKKYKESVEKGDKEGQVSLAGLLYAAYKKSKSRYVDIHKATLDNTKQLNSAASKLEKATIKLKSLSSGLAAANAAALAS